MTVQRQGAGEHRGPGNAGVSGVSVRGVVSMELACPNCGTRFRVADDAVGSGGRQVRCGACGHSWRAFPEEAAAAPSEPTAQPPAAPDTADTVEPEAIAAAVAEKTAAAPAPPLETGQDADSLPQDLAASVRSRPQPLPPPETGPRWGLLIGWLLFFAVVAGLLGGGWYFRDQVVAQVPETARLYDLLGIPVDQAGPAFVLDWRRAIRTEETGPTVTLSGQVINATDAPLPAPQLAVVLLNAQGNQIDSWAVEVDGGPIAPGEARDFATKGPWPEAASDVSVRLLQ